ncbi:MAG: hypothetical protein HQ580_19280 [Planctomycetes bacterium]|nr:hypothetical protein [Planctomycetota bacterium]
MEHGTRKELDDLLLIVDNWIRGYKTLLAGPGDEYLIEDLKEEVNEKMMPYISRLLKTEHITREEMGVLSGEIISKVAEFEKTVTCKGCEECDCG